MKTPKLFLLSFLILICTLTYGTVRTCNNNNPSPGQFTSFSSVYNVSNPGDTIYVSGSPVNYFIISAVSKQLTIIGTGHNPDKQNPLISSFQYIDVNASGSGTKIIGMNFTGGAFIYPGTNVNYESCKFAFFGSAMFLQSGSTAISMTFKKCIFNLDAISNGSFTGTCTANFNNCTFNGTMNAFSGTTLMTGSAANCLFLGNATASVGANLSTFSFTNNIFYGTSPQITGTNTATTMTKNISFNCPNNNFGGTTLSGNIVNSNPLFTTYAAPFGFDYTDNYNLQAASPGHLTGTDGKDIGLYGGSDGINFRMGGDPAIPQIRQMNVSSTNVPAGTPVNVNIISTRKQ